jgi:hypothetical protein
VNTHRNIFRMSSLHLLSNFRINNSSYLSPISIKIKIIINLFLLEFYSCAFNKARTNTKCVRSYSKRIFAKKTLRTQHQARCYFTQLRSLHMHHVEYCNIFNFHWCFQYVGKPVYHNKAWYFFFLMHATYFSNLFTLFCAVSLLSHIYA